MFVFEMSSNYILIIRFPQLTCSLHPASFTSLGKSNNMSVYNYNCKTYISKTNIYIKLQCHMFFSSSVKLNKQFLPEGSATSTSNTSYSKKKLAAIAEYTMETNSTASGSTFLSERAFCFEHFFSFLI